MKNNTPLVMFACYKYDINVHSLFCSNINEFECRILYRGYLSLVLNTPFSLSLWKKNESETHLSLLKNRALMLIRRDREIKAFILSTARNWSPGIAYGWARELSPGWSWPQSQKLPWALLVAQNPNSSIKKNRDTTKL